MRPGRGFLVLAAATLSLTASPALCQTSSAQPKGVEIICPAGQFLAPSDADILARPLSTNATKDEYSRYRVALTRQPLDALHLSFVDGRKGEATIGGWK
jgi:hypothetical protein